jgi:hypothetical protein
MSRKVADVPWEMLANAGGKRCYGIVGDALSILSSTRCAATARSSSFMSATKNTEFSLLSPRRT